MGDLYTSSIRLIYIEPEEQVARRIEAVLSEDWSQVKVHHIPSLTEAYALLQREYFDVALINHELPGESSFDFLSYLTQVGLDLPVVVIMEPGEEEIAIAVMKSGARDCIRRDANQQYLEDLASKLYEAFDRHLIQQEVAERAREEEKSKLIETIRTTVATVKHEINNPLAIISGNAQLLTELARGMDDEITKPIRDIEEASHRIAQSLNKLSNLKEVITREYVRGDSSLIDLRDQTMRNDSST